MENRIGQNFDKIADKYDKISSLQKDIAITLWELSNKQNKFNNICELGSGTGFLTQEIANFYKNSHISCFDLSQKSINIAKNKIKYGKVEYILRSFDEIDDFSVFDKIFSSMSLQWSCDLKLILNKINASKASFNLAIPVDGSLFEIKKKIEQITNFESILKFPKKNDILNVLNCDFELKKFSKTMKISDAIRLLSSYKTKHSNNSIANIKKIINDNDEVEFSYDVVFLWR